MVSEVDRPFCQRSDYTRVGVWLQNVGA